MFILFIAIKVICMHALKILSFLNTWFTSQITTYTNESRKALITKRADTLTQLN